jgi:hypothetical protein
LQRATFAIYATPSFPTRPFEIYTYVLHDFTLISRASESGLAACEQFSVAVQPNEMTVTLAGDVKRSGALHSEELRARFRDDQGREVTLAAELHLCKRVALLGGPSFVVIQRTAAAFPDSSIPDLVHYKSARI